MWTRGSRAAVLVAAALPLSGCAAAFGGYDLAHNGLPRAEEELRRALAYEAPEAYSAVVEGEQPLPDDDLLRLMYAGIAARYAGQHDESSRFLDLASYVAEDRVTTSLSREALSMVTSDRALAYVPGRTERLMIPYLAALNFLEQGDTEGAAVEARRIEALLGQLDQDVPRDERPADSRFLHYFAGAVFEAAREWGSAEVAYRRAGSIAESLGSPWDRRLETDADSAGDVIVLVERGFVPHRVEQSVVIVLPPTQMEMLTEGSAGEKLLAAGEAAARVLISAAHLYGDRSGYYRDRGYQHAVHLEPWRDDPCEEARWSEHHGACDDSHDIDDNGHADVAPYLLRISWPVLYQEPSPPMPVRVRAGELGVDAVARLDVSAGARRDFDEQRAEMLGRTMLRAASKLALSASAEAALRKKDEGAARLVGLLTNVGTLLTERADTRSWHLLPGSVAMVRLRLPAGSHDLTLELDRREDGRGGRSTDLGTVQVRPGETTFLTTRLWR